MQCWGSQDWDLIEKFPTSYLCLLPSTCHHLREPPGAKGRPHGRETLDLAKLIRKGCPSHTVAVPCRHKDGELCEECDSTKSEHRGWDVGADLLSLDFSLQRSWRTLATFLCLTDG